MAENRNDVEIWKTIPEYPNYEVSNFGNIRSKIRFVARNGNVARLPGCDLKKRLITGYERVTLYNGSRNEHKQFFVHRLVADLFVPNPCQYPCVNHKDECRTNNHADNLEWCTHKYNSNYGTAIERRVKHQDWESIARKQSIPIEQCDRNGNVIATWNSMMECERETGFSSNGISRCCSGYLKTFKGYVWRKRI